MTAGNVIGSYPSSPLNVNVTGNLDLTIRNRDSSLVTGSVPGFMGVSGTLGGTVFGAKNILPGIPNHILLALNLSETRPDTYSLIEPKLAEFGATSTNGCQ